MVSSDTEFKRQIEELQSSYQAELPHELVEIEATWKQFSRDTNNYATLVHLHGLIHRMAGSAKTFGFPKLGDHARLIQQQLKQWLNESVKAGPQQLNEVSSLLGALHQAAQEVPQHIVFPYHPTTEQLIDSQQRLVYLLEDDTALAEKFRLELAYFGYILKCFVDTESLLTAVADQLPDVLVIDIILPEGPLAGTEVLSAIQERQTKKLPAIIVSRCSDIQARLTAVRGGAEAYLLKPVDTDLLLERLDQLTHRVPHRSYRILIIDDDVRLADHYALVLHNAGMEVTVINDPLQAVEGVVSCQPELILMDLYMPDCSGLELAKIIRQYPNFLSIPIVYLSTELNQETQFFAMRLGGDDFLTKPISDDVLVSSIAIRAERSRQLNALMIQDSLTGLLNHSSLKQHLNTEVSRAERSQSALVFAMIDIDHFKGVNDKYGHLMGDRVIKRLATLLKKRLRETDTVGRYGGEEFGVVFPECTEADAVRLLDEIRDAFSSCGFQHEDGVFNVTISIGIAVHEQGVSAEQLNITADKALYMAKNEGRNQIVVAENQK